MPAAPLPERSAQPRAASFGARRQRFSLFDGIEDMQHLIDEGFAEPDAALFIPACGLLNFALGDRPTTSGRFTGTSPTTCA